MEPDQDITVAREPLASDPPARYVLRHTLTNPLRVSILIVVALGAVNVMKVVPYPWAAFVPGFTVVLLSSWMRHSARKRWLTETRVSGRPGAGEGEP
ncbi:hypothetical protein SUDANB106_01051 [Streptomyces sp. enrichment culture]|uniref:hypothetical protein n=1 Tax=Streptomyces sp. enrichment culture TaxID=1795815 RepID=UPI003F54D052